MLDNSTGYQSKSINSTELCFLKDTGITVWVFHINNLVRQMVVPYTPKSSNAQKTFNFYCQAWDSYSVWAAFIQSEKSNVIRLLHKEKVLFSSTYINIENFWYSLKEMDESEVWGCRGRKIDDDYFTFKEAK